MPLIRGVHESSVCEAFWNAITCGSEISRVSLSKSGNSKEKGGGVCLHSHFMFISTVVWCLTAGPTEAVWTGHTGRNSLHLPWQITIRLGIKQGSGLILTEEKQRDICKMDQLLWEWSSSYVKGCWQPFCRVNILYMVHQTSPSYRITHKKINITSRNMLIINILISNIQTFCIWYGC